MQEYLKEKNGRKRKAKRIICDECGYDFLKRESWVKDKNYCSVRCRGKSQITRVEVMCETCGKLIKKKPSQLNKSKHSLYFCGRKCKDIAQSLDSDCSLLNLSDIRTGKFIYRKRAFNNYEHKCACCEYDEHVKILEVHHRDSNRDNNELENLVILCPNCHTPLTRKYAILTEDNELIWK